MATARLDLGRLAAFKRGTWMIFKSTGGTITPQWGMVGRCASAGEIMMAMARLTWRSGDHPLPLSGFTTVPATACSANNWVSRPMCQCQEITMATASAILHCGEPRLVPG